MAATILDTTTTTRTGRTSPPVRVVLGSASDLLRAGLTALLVDHRARVVIQDVEDAGVPDVEIFDPAGSSADRRPSLDRGQRIALVCRPMSQSESRTLVMNASRVLLVSVGAVELVEAVEAVHRAASSDGAAGGGPWSPGGPHVLSPREGEVLAAICRGLTNDEIAHELFISINSVKSHIRASYRKMDVVRRSQAVVWGIEHGY